MEDLQIQPEQPLRRTLLEQFFDSLTVVYASSGAGKNEVGPWASIHVKLNPFSTFDCDYCDTAITWGSEYERRVFREGKKRLRVERRHVRPQCPDAYPDCGR